MVRALVVGDVSHVETGILSLGVRWDTAPTICMSHIKLNSLFFS